MDGAGPAALLEEHDAEMIAALARPSAYPGDPSAASGVEEIQTHISHLYLTGDRVYKLRKAVVLPFLSFGTTRERNQDCVDEVALNRRLAPDVYLGIAPILLAGSGRWKLGEPQEELRTAGDDGHELEHCVVMRRLPKESNGLSMLEAGTLAEVHIDAVADTIAEFHVAHSLGTPSPIESDAWLASISSSTTETFELARGSGCAELDPDRIDACEASMRARYEALVPAFEARRRAGRIVDGHGDLRLDHVFFEADAQSPLVIDCVEFSEAIRHLDVATEVAFFAMDLEYRGRTELAERFLRRYAMRSDDYDLHRVVDYYIVHRALVRAAVAGVAAMETELGAEERRRAAKSAGDHLRLVEQLLSRRASPLLVIMCGMVGTGKSTVAETAADLLCGAVVSSDRTRKRLAGIDPEARATAAAGEGIYSPEHTTLVYDGLIERAEPVLGRGRAVVLDATYSRAEWRRRVQDWAREHGYHALLLEVRCREEVVLSRLEKRLTDTHRVSDAGPDFFAESARSFEPPTEWPVGDHLVVDSDRADWRDQLSAALRPFGSRPHVQGSS